MDEQSSKVLCLSKAENAIYQRQILIEKNFNLKFTAGLLTTDCHVYQFCVKMIIINQNERQDLLKKAT